MKNEIFKLIELQSLEDNLLQLNSALENIPIQIKEIEDELSNNKKEVQEAESGLTAIRKQYKDFEFKTQSNTALMKKNDTALMSIKTNKEYQAVLKGIDDLKLANSEIEDKMLACLDSIEEKEKELKASKQKLASMFQEAENKKATLEKELAEKEKEAAIILAKKEIKIKEVLPNFFEKYLKVKKIAGNKVVVSVVEGICKGCNMRFPYQEYLKLQKAKSIEFCPQCQRIVYYDLAYEAVTLA